MLFASRELGTPKKCPRNSCKRIRGVSFRHSFATSNFVYAEPSTGSTNRLKPIPCSVYSLASTSASDFEVYLPSEFLVSFSKLQILHINARGYTRPVDSINDFPSPRPSPALPPPPFSASRTPRDSQVLESPCPVISSRFHPCIRGYTAIPTSSPIDEESVFVWRLRRERRDFLRRKLSRNEGVQR